jgi:hypothetical protein
MWLQGSFHQCLPYHALERLHVQQAEIRAGVFDSQALLYVLSTGVSYLLSRDSAINLRCD